MFDVRSATLGDRVTDGQRWRRKRFAAWLLTWVYVERQPMPYSGLAQVDVPASMSGRWLSFGSAWNRRSSPACSCLVDWAVDRGGVAVGFDSQRGIWFGREPFVVESE